MASSASHVHSTGLWLSRRGVSHIPCQSISTPSEHSYCHHTTVIACHLPPSPSPCFQSCPVTRCHFTAYGPARSISVNHVTLHHFPARRCVFMSHSERYPVSLGTSRPMLRRYGRAHFLPPFLSLTYSHRWGLCSGSFHGLLAYGALSAPTPSPCYFILPGVSSVPGESTWLRICLVPLACLLLCSPPCAHHSTGLGSQHDCSHGPRRRAGEGMVVAVAQRERPQLLRGQSRRLPPLSQ